MNEQNRGLLIGAAICLGVSGCDPAPAEPMSFQDCVNLARAWHAKTGEKTTQATLNRCMCEAHPDEYGPACWVDQELATVREANRWLANGDHNEASTLPPGAVKSRRGRSAPEEDAAETDAALLNFMRNSVDLNCYGCRAGDYPPYYGSN